MLALLTYLATMPFVNDTVLLILAWTGLAVIVAVFATGARVTLRATRRNL